MITFSTEDYLTILNSLITVHQEAQTKTPSSELAAKVQYLVDYREMFDCRSTHRPISSLPRYLDGMTIHLIETSFSPLFVYEAVARLGHSALAERCKVKWKTDFELRLARMIGEQSQMQVLYGYFGDINVEVTSPSGEVLDKLYEKVVELGASVILPDLKDGRIDEIARSVHVLGRGLLEAKAAEADMKVGNPLTPELCLARILSADTSLHLWDMVALRRYGSEITQIKLRSTTENETVAALLQYLPNLKQLDLTDCVKLTSDAFTGGHPSLEKLTLEKTGLTEASFNRAQFPKLKEIIKQQPYTVLHMGSAPVFEDRALTAMESAQRIVTKHPIVESRLRVYAVNPTELNWKGFLTWFDAARSFKFHQNNEAIFGLLIDLMQEFWATAFRFSSTVSIGAAALNDVTQLIANRDKKLSPMQQIQLEQQYNRWVRNILDVKIENEKVAWREGNFIIARTFMKQQPRFTLVFLDELYRHLNATSQKLFQPLVKKKDEANEDDKDPVVMAVEYVSEVMMDLSHIYTSPSSESIVLKHFKTYAINPFKPCKSYYTVNYWLGGTLSVPEGPLFPKITDQTLACAFVTPFESKEKRVELLEHILAEFENLQSKGQYPLAKLVSGTMTEDDMPFRDVDGQLAHRLKSYSGVFHENRLPDHIKEKYFHALINGRLGGKNAHLLQVLEKLYNDKYITENWKSLILVSLKEMTFSKTLLTGSYYEFPTDDPFVLGGRQLLQRLAESKT